MCLSPGPSFVVGAGHLFSRRDMLSAGSLRGVHCRRVDVGCAGEVGIRRRCLGGRFASPSCPRQVRFACRRLCGVVVMERWDGMGCRGCYSCMLCWRPVGARFGSAACCRQCCWRLASRGFVHGGAYLLLASWLGSVVWWWFAMADETRGREGRYVGFLSRSVRLRRE